MDSRLRTELTSLPSPSERTTRLWDSIINVVIVHLGGRPACLVESADYHSDHRRWVRDWRLIQRLAVEVLGLHITQDEIGHPDYPRYIVSSKKIQQAPTNHQALGRLLGMTWTGQFYNFKMPRWSMTIYTTPPPTINLFTQVVVGSSIAAHRQAIHRMCRRWQRLWDRHTGAFGGFEFHVGVDHDPGTMERMARLLTDAEYVRANTGQYVNDVQNFVPEIKDTSRLLRTQSGRRRLHEIYSTRINT